MLKLWQAQLSSLFVMNVQIPGVEINLTNNSVGISAGRARSGGSDGWKDRVCRDMLEELRVSQRCGY